MRELNYCLNQYRIMQSSRGIVKTILLSIICFYLFTTGVCASGMNETPAISLNGSSSLLEKITAIPPSVSTRTPSSEIYGNTIPVANINSSPASNPREIIWEIPITNVVLQLIRILLPINRPSPEKMIRFSGNPYRFQKTGIAASVLFLPY